MKRYFWGIFFIVCFHSHAQEATIFNFKNEPLKSVLKKIEDTFNLRFSYAETVVENKFFTFSSKTSSLDFILNKIQQKSNLLFEKVSKRYYIVKELPKNSKTVCGYIFDLKTLKSLSRASIVKLQQKNGVVSNEKGYFQLHNLRDTDTVAIYYLGYKTHKISVIEFKKNKCKNIFLQTINEELGEVFIGEYITQGITLKDNGTTEIKPNKLEILPGLTEPDVLESLQILPGVQSPNESASGLHIRGGTPDQNLILWDGIKVYHSGHFFGMISAFNPYITDHISISKNGSHAKYGNRVSGVIDISSTQKIPLKTKGGFGFNLTHSDAYLKTSLFNNNLGIVAAVRRSFNDAINTITFNKLSSKVFQNSRVGLNQQNAEIEEVNSNFYFTDYNLKAIARVSKKDKITFSSLFVKNKLNYASIYNFDQTNEAVRDDLLIENKGFYTSWSREWNSKFKQNVSLSNSNYIFKYFGSNRFNENSFKESSKNNNVKEVQLNLSGIVSFNESKKLDFGYQYIINNVSFLLKENTNLITDESYLESDKGINKTHAFYAFYSYKKKKKTSFNFGLRAHNFSVTNNFFLEPRFHLEMNINKNLKINFAGELKHQSVSQIIEFNTSDFGLENQVWALVDNDDLSILTSKQLSAGVSYSRNKWDISAETYYKKINGLTSFTKGFKITQDYSQGSAVNYGVDLLIKKKIKNYRTWLSYALGWVNFTFDGINQGKNFAGNFDIRHNFNWNHSFKYKNFRFSLGWRFRTGKPYTSIDGFEDNNTSEINLNVINNDRLPNYHRLDFSTTYKFRFSRKSKLKGKLGVSLLNIYNKKNLLDRSYQTSLWSDNNIGLQENSQNGLGFTPNIVFRLNF